MYVPSKAALGQASLTKRPTSCVMLVKKAGKGEKKVKLDEEATELLNKVTKSKSWIIVSNV